MKKAGQYLKIITFLLILFVSVMAGTLIVGDFVKNTGNETPQVRNWNEGWYYYNESSEQVFVTLPYKREVTRSEKVTLYHDVTTEAGEYLLLQVFNEWMQVYADNTPIYESSAYRTAKHKRAPANGSNYVQIPEGTSTIALQAMSPYNGYGGSFPAVSIGGFDALKRMYANKYLYHYFFDLLILLAALVMFFYGLIVKAQKRGGLKFIYGGIMFFLVGVWLRTGTAGMEFTFLSAATGMYLSYIAWFMLPIAITLFLQYYFTAQRNKYIILGYFAYANLFVNLVLEHLGVVDFIEILPLSHMVLVIIGVTFLYDLFFDCREQKEQSHQISKAGMLLMVGCVCADMITYYLHNTQFGLLVRIGMVLFVATIYVEGVNEDAKSRNALLLQLSNQRKQQLEITLSQLQPHFLFNALGAARIMIRLKPQKAYDMIYDFSVFLRSSLSVLGEENLIQFNQELKQIKAYLNIENKRFQDRIHYELNIQETEFEIPPLTIEPLIVNAVRHGLRKGKDAGLIRLLTRKDDAALVIEVMDDGIGFDVSAYWKQIKETSKGEASVYMGLSNIKDRLRVQLGAQMEIESTPGEGTHITIKIPIDRGE